MGQHSQSDVPVPAPPVADLVVIQSTLALGGLKSLLNLPALAGDSRQRFECGLVRERVEPVVGMPGLLFDAAPHQQSVAPAILLTESNHRPVVEPFSFAARAGGYALPGYPGQDCALSRRVHSPLLPSPASAFVDPMPRPEHSQPPTFEPFAQLAVIAIDFISSYPAKRCARSIMRRANSCLVANSVPSGTAAASQRSRSVTTLQEGTVHDPPAPHPAHWRSRETSPPGCSRCAPLSWRFTPTECRPFFRKPVSSRSAPRPVYSTLPACNRALDPAPHPHPSAHDPANAVHDSGLFAHPLRRLPAVLPPAAAQQTTQIL